MKTTFITSGKGKRLSVVLPLKDYEKLLDAYEELQDIRLYDAVKAKKEERIPLEEYLQQRKREKMRKYQVLLTKTAQKQLDKLPDPVTQSLITVMKGLAFNPRPNGCK